MLNKTKANTEIRQALNRSGMAMWELADMLGCHPSTMTTRLRHELPADEKKRILKLIRECEGVT